MFIVVCARACATRAKGSERYEASERRLNKQQSRWSHCQRRVVLMLWHILCDATKLLFICLPEEARAHVPLDHQVIKRADQFVVSNHVNLV